MKKLKTLATFVATLLCGVVQAQTFTFDDWTSTNHEDGSTSSETYSFTLENAAELSFDWSVSSEGGYDHLIVLLNDLEILRYSGEQSGTYSQMLESGEYSLTISYSKDGSSNSGYDQAIVSNIMVGIVNSYTDENGITWTYRVMDNSVCVDSVTGYSSELVFPATLPYNNANLPITRAAFDINDNYDLVKVDLSATQIVTSKPHFSYCPSLQEVLYPTTLEKMEYRTFYNCSKLDSINWTSLTSLKEMNRPFLHDGWYESTYTGVSDVDLSNTVLESLNGTFYNLDCLVSVKLPSTLNTIGDETFYSCGNLQSVEIPSSVDSIGYAAFQSCHNLIKADIPNGVTTIGSQAFSGCNKLDVEIPASVTSIGDGAFYTYASEEMGGTADKVYKMLSTTPPARMENSFSSEALFVVPTASLNSYQTANVWSNYASNILPQNLAVVTVNVTAQPNGSGVLNAIGGATNQTKIVDLTVKGTINGYDFVMFKDKMTNLRYLDLSEADIVYNPYCYYEGMYYSQNDTLGAYAFHEENKLISIKLPKSVKYIGGNAFDGCSSLTSVDFGESLQGIGYYAFNNCHGLTKLVMPNTLKYIGYYAFYNCSSLSEIDLGRNLQRIESEAFCYCRRLRNIVLPDKLEYIGSHAFQSTGLKEVNFPASLERIDYNAFYDSALEIVRIPSSLRYIGDQAFKNCNNLNKVYTYTLEPTHINENTFSNFETAMLYVPTASGQNYYWDEGWKRFVNVDEFDGVFTYFYLNKDLVLDATTGSVDGIPEAELYSGSGLIVEDAVDLTLSDLKIYHDGSHGASIIAKSEEGNVHADSLHVHINVVPGRWYFFSFPFDLRKRDISLGNKHNQYVFRYYDGEERAKKGNGGWKNVAHTDNVFLKAAQGYIFQCSHEDVLTISLKDVTFKRENKQNELTEHVASNLQDASWNFIGNPYLSYYDIKSVNYVAPITIWNGYSYEAITAMDDDYTFAPFEAFFVQKPTGVADIEFYGESQITGREAGNGNNNPEMGASPSRREAASNATRSLVNITLSDGNVTDRTRVVFNEAATAAYETTCDAAKFSTSGVPQLYTIDSRAAKYAINERPMAEGIVTLGYTAPAQGNYVLEAPRMDVSVVLKDNVTGVQHDFSEGAYEFASEAGTYEGRFTIMTKTGTTGIDEVETATQAECYNMKGQRVEEAQEQGVYIMNNRKVVKR